MAHTTHDAAHGHGSHGHGHGAHGVKLNHEPTDIPLTGTTRAALVTMAIIGAVMVAMYGAWGLFEWRMRQVDQPAPPLAEKDFGRRMPATPRIQSTPVDDLARYRAGQAAKLSNYGWVDRNAGTVRIPIDRAIELLAQRTATIADPKAAAAPAAAPSTAPADPAAPATPPPAPAAPTGH
jgi:hypothetical protein